MPQHYLPQSDSGLLQWAQSFSTQITATPTAFGLVAAQATAYASSLSTYSAALTAASSENTRTKGTIAAKNTAKNALRALSMQLAKVVRGFPTITNQQLANLGLTVPSGSRAPVPPPALAPITTVKSVAGRIVRGNLRDATTESSRRRPLNAKGALILAAWGDMPPAANAPGWVIQGQTGRTTFVAEFPYDVPGGVPCYLSAVWYNERGEYSPASDPITVYLSAPNSESNTGEGESDLKIAA